jgi:hypothetical protein
LPSTACPCTQDMLLPHPSSFQLAQASFEPNLYLYNYPSILVPVILLVHMAYARWNLKFQF